jgi:PAS domain S-box-containing protein
MGVQSLGTVLIVDDDPAKRHSIAKILRRGGYDIEEVSTGLDALRMAAFRPDLIVLDVKLPDLSGFEVCRRIKEDPATATIPVLHISTTFVDLEDRVQGLEGGADGYLTDVLEPIELLATVKALLRARKAEEAAQTSSRQWQITFDAISDGVILLDPGGRVIQLNQAMEGLLGAGWNESSGTTIQDLLQLPPDDASSPFLRVIRTGIREIVELTLEHRWLRVTIDPIQAPGGITIAGLCIVSDITDRKQMEEELRRRADDLAVADRRKDEFLAMLAHELRNPLAPIRNALEVIRLNAGNPLEIEAAREIAERQVGHMARLLDDLLDVSRFTRGNIQLRNAAVDLTVTLKQAIESCRPLIKASGHHFATTLPTESVWIEGDHTRLVQIVSNLLNNAAKYTDRGGRIEIEANREGDEAVVHVRDNGIGLGEEMLPRVFDLFAQEDRSLDRSQGGLGIGLTLVRSLVSLHGGTVSARSDGPGMGSEFSVRLPLSVQIDRPTTATLPASEHPTTSRLRVLVVDDSEDSARSLARVMKLWGHDARFAHDGPTAIEVTSKERFDVVLLDIGLPGMDGYQVARELRSRDGETQPTLIALTGYGQDEDFLRSHSAGFDHHLVKPVNLDTIRKLLADRSSGT